ncbi:MAG: hypothetical protein HPY55_06660 [Firmicutes bacterium]|nr:hypothetical protein [Bacillota bacterium]
MGGSVKHAGKTAPALTMDHGTVLGYLQARARGRKRAVGAKGLARALRLPERYVRSCIHDLRVSGVLVGSTVEPPSGFFIPTNQEEADACSRHLWARVRETAVVARTFDAAAARLGLRRSRSEQIRFVFDSWDGDSQ